MVDIIEKIAIFTAFVYIRSRLKYLENCLLKIPGYDASQLLASVLYAKIDLAENRRALNSPMAVYCFMGRVELLFDDFQKLKRGAGK